MLETIKIILTLNHYVDLLKIYRELLGYKLCDRILCAMPVSRLEQLRPGDDDKAISAHALLPYEEKGRPFQVVHWQSPAQRNFIVFRSVSRQSFANSLHKPLSGGSCLICNLAEREAR
jgi:hypothetical protein